MRYFKLLLLTMIGVLYFNYAFAYDFEVDGLCYNILTNNTVEVTSRTTQGGDYSGELVIPNSVKYNNKTYAVTSIGSYAFYKCSGLTGYLTIPNSVTYIGGNAFAYCNSLTGPLTIPNSVTSIEDYTFANCSGFTGILTIPNSITSIGVGAFQSCTGLTGTLTIPNSVNSIGVRAFHNCQSFTGALVLPNSLTVIDGNTFSACRNISSLKLPNSLTSIGNNAFVNCESLKTVVSEILYPFDIPENAFMSISSNAVLQIPQGTKSLYQNFAGWTSHFIEIIESNVSPVTTYILSIKVTGNGSASFSGSTIKNQTSTFTVNEGSAATITFSPDSGNKIKSVKVNDTYVTSSVSSSQYTISSIISDTSVEVVFDVEFPIISFEDANVKAICVSNWDTNGDGELSEEEASAVSDIGNVFTEDRSIHTFDELIFFTGIDAIPNKAFHDCRNLSSIQIPPNVTRIGINAFNRCYGLKSIIVPNSVTDISWHAFHDCTGLSSVEISDGVTSIGMSAFEGCASLKSIYIPASVTFIGTTPFMRSGVEKIVVDANNKTYESPNNCNSIIEIATKTLVVGCKNSSIPVNTLNIGKRAFYYIGGLTSLDIPNSVKTIGEECFVGCGDLKTVSLSTGLTNIENSAFENCSGLSSISLLEGLEAIGSLAFGGCTGLTSITIPSSVKTLGGSAFSGCDGLTFVNFKCLIPISFRCFEKCIQLTTITISDGVPSIGNYAFYGCSSLPSIDLPSSLSSIGNGAFLDCEKLCKVKSEILTPFSIENSVFSGIADKAVLNVPAGTKSKYEAFPGWISNFSEIIEEQAVFMVALTALGNGSISYSGFTIRNSTQSFSLNEGTNMAISITPDNGYRIKSVKENSADVTSYVSNGTYTINSISRDTNVEIEFESIPPTTYTLSVKATGNGSASYDGTTIRGKSSSFTVNEGTSATIKFTPDNGYRIKSVKLNNTNVTSGVSDSQYTISNISANTTLEVEFEAIPITTYTLTIKATGNGSVSYNGTAIRGKTSSFTVNEGTKVSISLTPDNGYKIKSVTENNANVTSYVSNGTYTINSISRNTNVEVEFETIPPTTYTLSIKATGNGSSSYDGTTIRGKTSSFTVNEGTSANIKFTPDNGYRIKFVKLNSTNVTSSVSNNQYTIGNINANTTLEVEFEAIPVTTYSLTIKATGNGSASYNETTIRSKTSTFVVNEGTKVSISVTPDNGYRIKSVKENDTNVTLYVSNGAYTINSISRNTDIEVEFEAIPPTTYTLSIKATGNGSASYDGTTIRGKTSSFTVNEGTSATIKFTPDNGYRIKFVKLNSTNVTSSVSDNQYTIRNITANTTLEVEFEAIPITTYTLSIKATGNGSASFNGTTIRSKTSSFTVNEGAKVSISLTPDSGYRIKSVKENDTNVTSYVSKGTYTINSISRDLDIEVEFEAIPPTTYTLSIKATGNGSASYEGTTIRGKTSSFTVNEGTSATIKFIPDNGYRIKSVILNSTNVTSSVSDNQFTISSITANATLEVEFVEDVKALAVDGVNYNVVSQTEKTINVAGGNYGQVLTIPATVTSNGSTWKVVGIEADALNGNTELAAIIWNPEVTFTATVSNPNLLLYVKAEEYAPATIQNVVVNGTANKIVLKEANNGNAFYCPQAFTAQQISYTHNYLMQTGVGESKGWETMALPFDVQTITHETKGVIMPFARWNSGDAARPFWLMELTGTGFVEAGAIKAYTPYIISMPNNLQYDSQWLLNGKVTFAASGVTIGKTENLSQSAFRDRTFVPCFADKEIDAGVYALNVNNEFETNNSGMTEGSRFVLNMRRVHPFEAYMTSSSAARYAIGVFEDMNTGIQVMDEGRWTKEEVVYDLQGRKINTPSKKGVYIVNGKKMIIGL